MENDEEYGRMCETGKHRIYIFYSTCTLSLTLFKIFIDDLIRAVYAAKQGVKVGEDTVVGSMLDDFVGITERPEGPQKQIERALEYTRKWRVTANVIKCAILVCNEDNKGPVEFKWTLGEEELPIVEQYTHLGAEI